MNLTQSESDEATEKKLKLKLDNVVGVSKDKLVEHFVCNICLETLLNFSDFTLLSCHHCFHQQCHREWRKK